MAGVGLVSIVASLTVGLTALDGGGGGAGAPTEAPAQVATDTATPSPQPTINAQVMAYAPGQSSGWHLHQGVHVVNVVSGTLSIYDAGCVRSTYGPGETYVGGDATHLAANEADEPVHMFVTYVLKGSGSTATPTVQMASPTGCRS